MIYVVCMTGLCVYAREIQLPRSLQNWKKRWFVLYKNELKYYNTREDSQPLKVIRLEEASAVERDDLTGQSFSFR